MVIGIFETMKKFGYTRQDELGNTYYTKEADLFGKKIFDVKVPSEGVLKDLPNCLGIIQYETNYDAKAVPDIHSTKEYLLGFLVG